MCVCVCVYIYIYIYIYILQQCMVFTISLAGFVADQMQYISDRAQIL